MHPQMNVGAATVVGVDQQMLSASLDCDHAGPGERAFEHLAPDQRGEPASREFQECPSGTRAAGITS